jgi:hypothetical protein
MMAIASTNIACGQTPEKTPNDAITGTDHKENASTVAWLPIVACLSVAVATVVDTCHIAYSMHVTILIKLNFYDHYFIDVCTF